MKYIAIVTCLFAAVTIAEDGDMPLPQHRRDGLEARATTFPTSCTKVLASLAKDFPTAPPSVIADDLLNGALNPCSFKPPKSVSKDYSSYSKHVSSWVSKHTKSITSAASKCPQAVALTRDVFVCPTKFSKLYSQLSSIGSKAGIKEAEATPIEAASQPTNTDNTAI